MKYQEMSKTKYLFYILIHPSVGFEELKFNKKMSLPIANLLVLLFVLATIVKQVMASFIFTTSRIEDINILWTALGCIGGIVLFSLCNWLFCTLLDGKGKFFEIYVVTAYATLPFTMFSIPLTIIGNFFTIKEAFFYNSIMTILYIWMFLLLFIGTLSIHQFSIKKNILTLVFTLLGIIIVLFLLLLLFTLLNNVFTFFITVYNELSFRI